MATAKFSAEYLREHLHYDPDTGFFTRIKSIHENAKLGPFGSLNTGGYMVGSLQGQQFYLHRAAWLYVYGHWPTQHIDHIDGNRVNNAIKNLRDVSVKVNMQNVKRHRKHNKLGLLGVYETPTGKFVCRIVVGEKPFHKTYETKEEAFEASIFLRRFFHEGNTL